MQSIAISDDMLIGAISIEHTDDYVQPWRIPHQQRELYYPLIDCAADSAGIRLQLHSDSSCIEIDIQPLNESCTFDLCCQNKLIHSYVLEANEKTIRFDLSTCTSHDIDIWLPLVTPTRLRNVRIDANSHCTARSDTRLKWLTYGSSITQCRTAHSAARSWPAIVARKHNLNLCCLGYRGNCILEPLVATMISQQPADLITLKLGINVRGNGSLNVRSYQTSVIGLIQRIREKHPHTPIGVITSLISEARETHKNHVGMSLQDYRHETEEAVRRVRLYGDQHIELYDGLSIFGKECTQYLPDDLHPNGDGYEVLAHNISEQCITPILEKHF